MKTGFNDPIEVKEGKTIKSPWNFDCPNYDQRSSSFVNAGSNYGVGHKCPVGKSGNPEPTSPVYPLGRRDLPQRKRSDSEKMLVSPDEKV